MHSLWTRTSTGSTARRDVAAHERQVRLVVAVGLVGEAAELAVLGRQPGVGDAVDDDPVNHRGTSASVGMRSMTRSKRTSAPSDADGHEAAPRQRRRWSRRRRHGTARGRRRRRTPPGRRRRRSGRRGRPAWNAWATVAPPSTRSWRTPRPPSSSRTAPRSPDQLEARVHVGAGGRPTEHDAQRVGPSTWRTVSDGSSARTVPAPTRTAWLSARRRWASVACVGAGDPLARAVGGGGAAVDGRRQLEHHVRTAGAPMRRGTAPAARRRRRPRRRP